MTPQAKQTAQRVSIAVAVIGLGLLLKIPLLWLVIGMAAWWLLRWRNR